MRMVLARILNFFYFIVSSAEILRLCKKILFDRATIGGDIIIPLSLRLSRIEFSLYLRLSGIEFSFSLRLNGTIMVQSKKFFPKNLNI